VKLIAQRAHQLDGLGGVALIHGGIVASLASFRRRNGLGSDDSLNGANTPSPSASDAVSLAPEDLPALEEPLEQRA
jgi:hypothetical protein